MNNNIRKKMTSVLVLIIIMFLSIALYITYFQVAKAKFYANHVDNSRNIVDENKVLRGTIRDRLGNTLTYTDRYEDGSSKRINNYNYLYSHIIGYSSKEYGKTGIERYFNKELLNVPSSEDLISRIEDAYESKDRGKDIYLTVDSDLQSYLYQLMSNFNGAAVVINPQTGDILGMMSMPTFNINTFEEDWNYLTSDDSNAILINRATQGIYVPGSIFKVITSIALLENDVDLSYEDMGSTTIDGYTINNYKDRSYGEIDLRKALVKSSNVYFADKAKELTNRELLAVTDRLMLGKEYEFDIGKNRALIPYKNNLDELEKSVVAFGQGETLVSPLDMANVIAAIANDGVMMKPRLVNKLSNDDTIIEIEPSVLSKVTSDDIVEKMQEYLTDTASENGVKLSDGRLLAGKSGTAEVDDTTHSWYVGYGPSENPKYAIAVVLEYSGMTGNEGAGQIFKEIMEYLEN